MDSKIPEMMNIVIIASAALSLLTFLMVLIQIVSLSRIKKRLLNTEEENLALKRQYEALQQTKQAVWNIVARLTEIEDKINSVDRRLDRFDDEITESQKQLSGHALKLNEHDTLLAQAGQMMGKEAAGFKQAIQRIHTFEEEVQNLKAFQCTFEQVRHRILEVLGAMQVK